MKIPKRYKTYKKWILDLDRSGAIYFSTPTASIYCSPNWEGVDGLSIEIHDYEKDANPQYIEVTKEKIKNANQWFALVKPFLDIYEVA